MGSYAAVEHALRQQLDYCGIIITYLVFALGYMDGVESCLRGSFSGKTANPFSFYAFFSVIYLSKLITNINKYELLTMLDSLL